MAMGLQASRRGRRRGRAPMAEINVTPFVDVMLVLLIIFMVTAPLLTAGVPVELPDSRANPIDQDPRQVTVSIDREGYIFIDKERVPVGGFPAALAALDSGGEKPVVTLRADKALDYGRVMAVMGELNRGGFNSISLVTNSSVSAP
ncbi:Biopolymer transport protein ExbD [Tsuneonella dongtanensis]|uniref:Biopolymer transport protein ExbD n=1 Tax=Tsuneonella dongtanensis TaxID=692370 RepID=A0A1B2ADG6_9SPHN|nr:biopolymer transporter ExbD [Tsuneonella dongtanensis]ANY20193.1 Biopolymer transport protein ExbD [Tsuneonella dongtanensis]